MHIWLLSAYDQPRGMSSRSYDIALGLIERGHKVTLFTNSYCHWTNKEILKKGEQIRVQEIDGIKTVWLRTYHYKGSGLGRGINMISNAYMILRHSNFLDEKPDTIVGPSVPLLTGLVAYLLAKRHRSKFIFEIRDVWPIALVDSGAISKRGIIYFFFRIIEKFLYKKATYISSTLPFVQNHIQSSGSDPTKVVWIPNCMSGEKVVTKEEAIKDQIFRAVYLGGFGQEHDVMNIVRAAEIIKKQNIKDIQFIFYGSGPKKDICIKEASKAGLNNIVFRDTVPKNEVQNTLKESDILLACLINSPVYKFGINLNKIYDYFLAEKPIVFSGNTPNDPIQDSSGGISLPPENPQELANAIIKLKDMTPKERGDIGTNGFNYAKINYSRDTMVSKFNLLISQ